MPNDIIKDLKAVAAQLAKLPPVVVRIECNSRDIQRLRDDPRVTKAPPGSLWATGITLEANDTMGPLWRLHYSDDTMRKFDPGTGLSWPEVDIQNLSPSNAL